MIVKSVLIYLECYAFVLNGNQLKYKDNMKTIVLKYFMTLINY